MRKYGEIAKAFGFVEWNQKGNKGLYRILFNIVFYALLFMFISIGEIQC